MNQNNYQEFMDELFVLRAEATPVGFTDKSRIEKAFLPFYEKLIGTDKPSVTEYGSGVPLLSLYLAAIGKVDKVFAIEKDPVVLQELEHIVAEKKLPVEMIVSDLNLMGEFPDTDVGISLNCLFGYAPTFYQGATGMPLDQLPVITTPILEKTSHNRFGLFRYMNNDMPWEHKDNAISAMERNYANTEATYSFVNGHIRGCLVNLGNSHITPFSFNQWGMHTILGFDN